MDDNYIESDIFEYSQEPSRLEAYKCYDDQSKDGWITGQELLDNKSKWDSEIIERWNYFYRPYNYGKNIGKIQREKIKLLSQEYTNKKDLLIRLEDGSLEIKNINILSMLISVLFSFVYLYTGNIYLLLPWLVTLYLTAKNKYNNFVINKYKKLLVPLEEGVSKYESELSYLLEQHKELKKQRLTPSQVESIFWEKLADLEKKLIKSELGKDLGQAITNDFSDVYKNTEIGSLKKRPKFPVIPSWGFLQQSQCESVRGVEVNSLDVISKDIGDKLVTWRKVTNNKPFFRLWYLQYFFFQERNINIVSLYYDFITGEQYSKHLETYQYNHITNYSYITADISKRSESDLLDGNNNKIKIPNELTVNVFGNQVDTLSFASASGSSIQCTLPSENVSKGLERWLKYRSDLHKFSDRENMSNEDRQYFYNQSVEVNKLFSTIARETLKKLRNKVEEFSIAKDDVYN